MNKLIKTISQKNNCSNLQASIIINHCKYLIKKYLENLDIQNASQVCLEVLGMSETEATRLEQIKVEVKAWAATK